MKSASCVLIGYTECWDSVLVWERGLWLLRMITAWSSGFTSLVKLPRLISRKGDGTRKGFCVVVQFSSQMRQAQSITQETCPWLTAMMKQLWKRGAQVEVNGERMETEEDT